jgi:hypothetical protein
MHTRPTVPSVTRHHSSDLTWVPGPGELHSLGKRKNFKDKLLTALASLCIMQSCEGKGTRLTFKTSLMEVGEG